MTGEARPRRGSAIDRGLLGLGVLVCLVGCGSAEGREAPAAPSASVAAPPIEAPASDRPAPPARAPDAPAVAATPEPPSATPVVDAARVLPDCLWFADPSPPATEGPGSMGELDDRLRSELGREARVVGRVRLAARGCPRLSAGVAVVRAAADVAEDDDDLVPLAIAGDDPGRAPVAGARGDERRDSPWGGSGGAEARAECDADAPPGVYLFRARHDATTGAVGSIVLDSLELEACGFYGHDLQHGDLDRDGTTELRVETETGGVYEMSAGAASVHRLWIYDLAELRPELAIRVGGRDAAEVAGYFDDATRGAIALRDVDGDGDRDVIVRRFSEGYEDNVFETYRHWSTEVHAYDAPTDTFRRAQELDARVSGRE